MTTVVAALCIAGSGSQGSGAAAPGRATDGAWETRHAEGGVAQSAQVTTQSTAAAPERCPHARKALRYYRARYAQWRHKMGAGKESVVAPTSACPRYLARVWRAKARAARAAYERWWHYHYAWWAWLPDKWQRIGACETGYGERPGQWTWNSGTYQGAFGFYHGSWDAFVPHADPKAGPYPGDAHLATPRQQYEVALAIWRRYGFSGWGCRGA